MLKVRVRYCGGCNPEIDRVALVGELQQELARVSIKAKLVRQDQENPDLVLLVNGCRHAGLEEGYLPFEKNIPIISIEGGMVWGIDIGEKGISNVVLKELNELMEKKGKS